MREQLIDMIKWTIVIAIAALAFYTVCPKYYFALKPDWGCMRANKITGKVEIILGSDGQYQWHDIDEVFQKNKDQSP